MKIMDKTLLSTETCIEIEDDIWFMTDRYNILFKMNKSTEKVEYVCAFNEEKFERFRLYRKIVLCQDRIVCIPYNARKIGIVDVNTYEIRYVNVKDEDQSEKYWGVCVYHEYIFMFGLGRKEILRLNVNNMAVDSLDAVTGSIPESIVKGTEHWFGNTVCLVRDMIYCTINNSNIILALNAQTLEANWHMVGLDTDSYSGMLADEEGIWLLKSNAAGLLYWNINNHELKEYSEFSKCDSSGFFDYVEMILLNDHLYIFPCLGRHIIKLDINSEQIQILSNLDTKLEDGNEKASSHQRIHVSHAFISGAKIYIFSYINCTWIIYDTKTKDIRMLPLLLPQSEQLSLLQHTIDRGIGNICEGIISLDKFLDFISLNEEKDIQTLASENGSNIYEKICSAINI